MRRVPRPTARRDLPSNPALGFASCLLVLESLPLSHPSPRYFQAGGSPENVIQLLSENYTAVAQTVNLLAEWLIQTGTGSGATSSCSFGGVGLGFFCQNLIGLTKEIFSAASPDGLSLADLTLLNF